MLFILYTRHMYSLFPSPQPWSLMKVITDFWVCWCEISRVIKWRSLYVRKVFLACWDWSPETVWASMSTGWEQILVQCFLLRSLRSSESPSLVTSPSSNQAVSHAAGGEGVRAAKSEVHCCLISQEIYILIKKKKGLTVQCRGKELKVCRSKTDLISYKFSFFVSERKLINIYTTWG